MYLSNIKLWNFRKFGAVGEIDIVAPEIIQKQKGVLDLEILERPMSPEGYLFSY